MTTVPSTITLPDTLSSWPWPRQVNPHYEEISFESAQWVKSFGLFSPNAQVAFDRCNFGLLAALAYPLLKKEHLRSAADFMAALYCFDEYTDQGDEAFVRQAADAAKDALRNPFKSRPEGEMPIGEVFRQFLARTVPICSESVQQRLVETQERAMDGQVQQCVDRKHDFARNSKDYLAVRLHSSSMLPSYVIMELDIDVPDEVYYHPLLENLRYWGFMLICIDNDIFSYNIERARGQALHNWVTLTALERNVGIQEAVDYLGALHHRTKESFLEATKNLPSWGEPIDSEVRRYIDGIGNWVRANYEWSFESRRYFDTHAAEVRRTLQLTMLPKVVVADSQAHWAPRPGEVIPGLETALNLVPDADYMAVKVAA
ncbi:isoprenoid synthase domain-containing protein [Mycena pura]|uniref:Terpene synthase n=1 Tax=Mycena pura TaxID=153505 RepID=A0AAD6V6W1_9AGAR|nr:isoprenoid synthase domain-containing protein [Mycena pura]